MRKQLNGNIGTEITIRLAYRTLGQRTFAEEHCGRSLGLKVGGSKGVVEK